MQTFLQAVAASLLKKFGTNMSRVTVVFPGKRAGLFLDQALAELAGSPVWSPRYLTIADLFAEASPYTICNPIEAVCRLHHVYKQELLKAYPAQHADERPQELDQFYGWGEVLLADFDDIDKHLVDTHRLFANIYDLRALDDNSYITPEQEKALRQFFANFSIDDNSQLKQRFLKLWQHMGDIYDALREDMLASGVLYEGALQRMVVEEGYKADDTTYVFVGFNVLNAVESALFDQLNSQERALFYWDYDAYYTASRGMRQHEAGYFIKQDIARYGNELDASLFHNLSQPKDIAYVTSTTESGQTRYISQWLAEHQSARDNETAIVLCNEQLLQPVLHSLPKATVNVTMGFPLAETPVAGFINELMVLCTDGYDCRRHRFRPYYMTRFQNHPYAKRVAVDLSEACGLSGVEMISFVLGCVEKLGVYFSRQQGGDGADTDILQTEAVFKAYTTLNKLLSLMRGDNALLRLQNDAMLCRVLRAALAQQTVPFHGEPATGLQVLGVLETRALDFRHLLMLSVGEGYLPRLVGEVSFIPYNLREAFGLTTQRHRMAVYAYYFYRLIQRAESVTFVYNDSNVGVRQNEMSRFLRQLLAETTMPVRHLYLQPAPAKGKAQVAESVEKGDAIVQQLRLMYDHSLGAEREKGPGNLSPTALNTYTSCPMQFYYKYVKGLRVDPDPEDGLDQILFGNIFHTAAEQTYKHLTAHSRNITAEDIRRLLSPDDSTLDDIVDAAFKQDFFKEHRPEYTGILIIARRVMLKYLEQLLRYDMRHAPIKLLGVEASTAMTVSVDGMKFSIGGIIDRLDEVMENSGGQLMPVVRIVDYKTGGKIGRISSLDRLFKDTGQNEHYYFQTLLYAISVATSDGGLQAAGKAVAPCLFYIAQLTAPDYRPQLTVAKEPVTDAAALAPEFMRRVEALISEIFNPDVPFTQATKADTCHYCNYRTLCKK